MSQKNNNKESGFTIIEVVLVLAIAGLIFLIVFLALPQLQKSRRDTQRKNDAARIAAALESFAGNSNGAYPTAGASGTIVSSFMPTYVTGQNLNDPSSGSDYATTFTASITGAGAITGAAGVWNYFTNAACTTNGDTGTGTGPRSVAIRMKLEQGVYCVDNT